MSEKKQLSIKEVQLKMLDVMKDIDRFCRANDIPYSLACGTLLGAVRHGGFIPWDDDADLFMLREDFDRFVKIYKSDKYQVSYILDNKEDGYFNLCLAKVIDPNAYTDKDGKFKHAGIFVDIFPLDGVPEDTKECRKRMHRIAVLENRIFHRRRNDLISILKSYWHTLDWWIDKFDKIVHDKSYYDSEIVAHAVGSRKYEVVMPRSEFANLKNITFEGYDFLAMPDTHHYLITEYGEDYMTPRQWNHNMKVYEYSDSTDNHRYHSKLWLNTAYILKAHIFNPIWKNRDSRRKTRYDATYNFVMDYLQRYAEEVRKFEVDKTDDLEEPERAFTIWFQGEDRAPELVKACFRSMRSHLKQELVIIDEKSLFEWISLPEYIIEKWKKGAITHAAFSDICRVELLYRHGGIWLDATDFVTAPIPEFIMNENFFVFMAGNKVRGNYAKIQSCFMRGKKGNPILSIWRKAIFLYWKNEKRKINYFWMHFLLRLVVENNEVAKQEFAKMPKINQDPTHELWGAHAGDVFDKDEFDRICSGSFFQKTNFKDKRLRNVSPESVAQHVLNSNL